MNKTNIEWADLTVNPLIFETLSEEGYGCPYRCQYPCYGRKLSEVFPNNFPPGFDPKRIKGKMRGKTIFVESMGDLFHPSVTESQIQEVLMRCHELDPSNTIAFLTKNAKRYEKFISYYQENYLWGVTLETNFYPPSPPTISQAPQPYERVEALRRLPERIKRFISVEPTLEFSSNIFLRYLREIKPLYIIFGANSMGSLYQTLLLEPTPEKLRSLVQALRSEGQTVLIKRNAKRLGLIPYYFKIKHYAISAPKRQKGLEDFC